MTVARGSGASHIFLSYSRHDAAYVDAVSAHLEQSGFRTWFDRKGIAGGEQWRREIVDAVQKASLLALFLSPNSARSDNVRRELDLADQARVKVLPLAIAPTDIPDEMKFQLAGIQMIELWRDYQRGLGVLVKTLQRHGVQAAGTAGPRPARGTPPPPRTDIDLSELGGAKALEKLSLKRLFGWKR
jgi:hypothetical protein